MDIKKILHFTGFPTGVLAIILLLSFLIRTYNLNYNSPFLDEAQYIILGQKVLAGHWQESNPFSWVGGMPLLYPPIAALFGTFGYLGARFLNVIFGTMSVNLLYMFAKNLQFSNKEKANEIIGLISSALLGIFAIPLYLSRLAIYDMPSFTFFLMGLVLLQKALLLKKPKIWQQENRFFFSSLFFLLSFLTKYTAVIFLPFILLWAFYSSRRSGKEGVNNFVRHFASILVIGIVGYFVWHFDALLHFFREQVGASQNQSFQILTQFFKYSLPAFLFALLGVFLLFLQKRRSLPLMLLLGASVIPVVHLTTNNIKAVDQQTFLSLIFLLPLAAYFFSYLLERMKITGGFMFSVILIGIFIISQNQLKQLQTSWSNTTNIMNYVKLNTSNHERLLSFEDDVTKLYLTNLKEENITGIYDFTYQNISGENAYNKAIKDGYFDLILFNDERIVDISKTVKSALTKHYEQIYKEDHHFFVYKLNKD